MGRTAGTPNKPKTTTATPKEKVEVKTTPKVEKEVKVVSIIDKEKEELKATNDAMTKMLEQMQEQMKMMQMQINMQSSPNIVLEQNKDITRTVKVTSLVGNILTLSTMKNGNKAGRTYKFEKYGQTQPILFSDMQQILIYHTKQFEVGKVILTSQKDYDDLGIGYMYDSIQLKEVIDEIVMLKDENAIDTIFDMNEDMQEKVIDLIAQNLANGVSYDYNKIKELKDEGFDVEAIAEEIKNVPSNKKEDDEE